MFVGIIVLAIIGAFFVYRAVDGFISRMTIAKLPGVPVLKDPPTQAPVDVNNPEPSPDLEVNFEEPVDLDTFVMPDTWDGKKRVNILIMGIDARSPPDVKAPPLTDSMILFTLDPVANTAAMLSIPVTFGCAYPVLAITKSTQLIVLESLINSRVVAQPWPVNRRKLSRCIY